MGKAFLQICQCGLHARIKLPDGNQSYDFFSSDDGLKVANAFQYVGRISKEELRTLSKDIVEWKFLVDKVLPQLRKLMNNTIEVHGDSAVVTDEIFKILRGAISSLSKEYVTKNKNAHSKGKTQTEDERTFH